MITRMAFIQTMMRKNLQDRFRCACYDEELQLLPLVLELAKDRIILVLF